MSRDVIKRIRISEEEEVAWQKAADDSDMKVSDWVRRRCNGKAGALPAVPKPAR